MSKPAKKLSTTEKREKEPSKKYTAPALEKGLEILELFAGQTEGLIKSEVARQLNRTNSEVFRMLVCLQNRGYISQGENEEYRLTLRLFQLAQQHPPTKRLIYEAMTVMHNIADRIYQSCHLAVIEDGIVVILAQAASAARAGFSVKSGSQIDLMSAGSGYVILANQNSSSRSRILEQVRQRGCCIPADLDAHLERIRRQGFEQQESYEVKGILNISFPILDNSGQAIAALSVPFLPRLKASTTDTDVVEALRKGAEILSKAMGYVEHNLSEQDHISGPRSSEADGEKGIRRVTND